MEPVYHIFVGYEPIEDAAYKTCVHSILKHATVPVKIHKLDTHELRKSGLFTREWLTKANGQMVCQVDGRPFSTSFSHTRFLVPTLWHQQPEPKSPLVLFVDCDFVFTADIREMFEDIERQKTRLSGKPPVYCVQHDYQPVETSKMHGVEQSKYNMKLWTSLMVFDMDHVDNQELTADVVNTEDGRKLHQFCWLKDVHQIGKISESWNFIPNHSEKNVDTVKAIHWTSGGSWFSHMRSCRYAELWNKYFDDFLSSTVVKSVVDRERFL